MRSLAAPRGLVGLCLGLLGCNAIFGLEEGSPVPAGGGGSAGASDGGAGATTSSGGAAAAGASSGGQGAAGAAGASGGSAGSGAGGSTSNGGSGGGAICAPSPLIAPACEQCVESKGGPCCSAINACSDSKACNDYLTCLEGPNPGFCGFRNMRGKSLADAISDCLDAEGCSTPCVTSCGGNAIPGPPSAGNLLCTACLAETCCQQQEACSRSAACIDCITNGSSCENTELDDQLADCEASCPC